MVGLLGVVVSPVPGVPKSDGAGATGEERKKKNHATPTKSINTAPVPILI